jgi:hypothetical protein
MFRMFLVVARPQWGKAKEGVQHPFINLSDKFGAHVEFVEIWIYYIS